MTIKEKPAPGAIGETGYGDAFGSSNSTALRSRIKTAIVGLAVTELIPAGLASWLIQHGGLLDE